MDESPWTCPFCSLLCDDLRVARSSAWRLEGSDCPRARRGLAHFDVRPADAPARVRGTAVDLDTAVATAARWLQRSRLPLFGGLATDVAGARALYRLAARVGAVCDHAAGDALFHALRAQQDRGSYYTTLAEVRARADLIVCVGTQPSEHYPEFFRRCGIGAGAAVPAAAPAPREAGPGEPMPPTRVVFFVDAAADPALHALPGVQAHSVNCEGNLFDTVARLNALVAQRAVADASPALRELAQRLRDARYAVLVWEPGRLPRHGALVAEALQRLVGTLNRHTRAATFALGGSEGAYTAHQVTTWMSGLPLRTHAGPLGLDHDPVRHAGTRLLDDGAVDALLWVSSFGPEPSVPASALPRIVLGHPAARVPEGDVVFIPVATPGVGAAGHLFRADGGVVLPLHPLRDDPLPGVAQVVDDIARHCASAVAA